MLRVPLLLPGWGLATIFQQLTSACFVHMDGTPVTRHQTCYFRDTELATFVCAGSRRLCSTSGRWVHSSACGAIDLVHCSSTRAYLVLHLLLSLMFGYSQP